MFVKMTNCRYKVKSNTTKLALKEKEMGFKKYGMKSNKEITKSLRKKT